MARTNRELVMLADTYNRAKHRSAGMYMSEKLDGMRCLWIPATKGIAVANIPFANREKDNRKHIATGLWSRYGKVIHCPEFFVEDFPNYPLDGELYIGRQGFQTLMSVVKELVPVESEWKHVQFLVFDAPKYRQLFADGKINNQNYVKQMKLVDNLKALNLTEGHPHYNNCYNFDSTYKLMKRDLKETHYLQLHHQTLLPFATPNAIEMIDSELEKITSLGGEGLVLRNPSSFWEPIRSSFLLKLKKYEDAEAQVIGWRTGLGKYSGMLGSLTVRWQYGVFELSGFDDQERTLTPAFSSWAAHNPGKLLSECPLPIDDEPCPAFPHGAIITFRYRELTKDNAPKEARYLRRRDETL